MQKETEFYYTKLDKYFLLPKVIYISYKNIEPLNNNLINLYWLMP
jgi:hypothetical protein